MGYTRKSHVQKNLAERQQYFDNYIKKGPTPTIEDRGLSSDSTEYIADMPQGHSLPTRELKADSPIAKLLKEKWAEIIITIAMLGLGSMLYGLNREIGEIKILLSETRNQHEKNVKDIQQVDERLEKKIDKIADRVDGNTNQKP